MFSEFELPEKNENFIIKIIYSFIRNQMMQIILIIKKQCKKTRDTGKLINNKRSKKNKKIKHQSVL